MSGSFPQETIARTLENDSLSAMAKAQGRPRQVFDLALIEGLGKLGMSQVEMAALLKTTNATISRRMAAANSEFCKAYQTGFSSLQKSLRRAQISGWRLEISHNTPQGWRPALS